MNYTEKRVTEILEMELYNITKRDEIFREIQAIDDDIKQYEAALESDDLLGKATGDKALDALIRDGIVLRINALSTEGETKLPIAAKIHEVVEGVDSRIHALKSIDNIFGIANHKDIQIDKGLVDALTIKKYKYKSASHLFYTITGYVINDRMSYTGDIQKGFELIYDAGLSNAFRGLFRYDNTYFKKELMYWVQNDPKSLVKALESKFGAEDSITVLNNMTL